MLIRCDNRSAINHSVNVMYHGRSKHIDISHHFLKDLVADNKIKIEYLSTEDMVADILTKGLSFPERYHCCKLLGINTGTSI